MCGRERKRMTRIICGGNKKHTEICQIRIDGIRIDEVDGEKVQREREREIKKIETKNSRSK